MDELLAEVSRSHHPRPPATSAEIAEFEARVGWKLDDELRAFYLHSNGAELFEPLPNAQYIILPLAKIRRARVAIRGRDEDSAGPPGWWALVNSQDGEWALLDVSAGQQPYPLLEAWHETFPGQCQRIAGSFREFLAAALAGGDRLYWLQEGGPLDK
ncbi:SMI1/KNR4 family protein [Myxococcus landrumensis]|uniref:SMI1/KNR4 family protein n=2 Tax=Myxococcus landrumensis TaxID=2813577 RepID=A0ABX7NHB5_9BACT|nr:SMI1/KNR4 family protein [Myxococcus landrumus]